MIYRLTQTRFLKRWKVHEIGHTEGDETWVATFRIEVDAQRFISRCLEAQNATN